MTVGWNLAKEIEQMRLGFEARNLLNNNGHAEHTATGGEFP